MSDFLQTKTIMISVLVKHVESIQMILQSYFLKHPFESCKTSNTRKF